MIYDNLRLCPHLEMFSRNAGEEDEVCFNLWISFICYSLLKLLQKNFLQEHCTHYLFNRNFNESVRTCGFRRVPKDYVRSLTRTRVLVGSSDNHKAQIDCGIGNLDYANLKEGMVREKGREISRFLA